jgi:putative toxin-antitoxin system antitoxin component (TIGR02293 family)
MFSRNFVYLCIKIGKTMKNTSQVSEAMITYGSTDDNRAFTIMQAIREGFGFSFFNDISQKMPFSFQEWGTFLHLSPRTMQRYKKEQKTFDPIYSERIAEITMLYNYGKEVFGDEDKFQTWLNTSNIALGGEVPRDLLDSTLGIGVLKDELGRIEHGVLA